MASTLAPPQVLTGIEDTSALSTSCRGPGEASVWARIFPASFGAICRNYISAAALLILGYSVYWCLHEYIPFYRVLLPSPGFEALYCGLIAYLAVLPVYYATFPDNHRTKCRLFWEAMWHRNRLSPAEQLAVRAVAVKAFFLPLMVNWGTVLFFSTLDAWSTWMHSGRFLPDGYWVGYRGLFMIDVLVFIVGYAVEHPWLKNEIRSVEPTIAGWAVALACYPPFSGLTRMFLGWSAQDYPAFGWAPAEYVACVAMLVLIAIYSWASVALGFKASNLTSRGIVSRGPYAWVRHPAYVGKNLAWWIASLPGIFGYALTQPRLSLTLFVGMSGWSLIYFLRALTEERHLKLSDPDYQAYCERVPYRFIPGIF